MLAVYFDKNKKVIDKAVYGLQDGKPVTDREPPHAVLRRRPHVHRVDPGIVQ